MKRLSFMIVAFVLLIALLSITGCSAVGVQVWERDILSKPEMQLDTHSIDNSLDDHIYFSKEASSGGRSFGGGGCGCN